MMILTFRFMVLNPLVHPIIRISRIKRVETFQAIADAGAAAITKEIISMKTFNDKIPHSLPLPNPAKLRDSLAKRVRGDFLWMTY